MQRSGGRERSGAQQNIYRRECGPPASGSTSSTAATAARRGDPPTAGATPDERRQRRARRWVGGWGCCGRPCCRPCVARVAAARGDVQVEEPAARGAAAVARATATAPHGASWSRVEVEVAHRPCAPRRSAASACSRPCRRRRMPCPSWRHGVPSARGWERARMSVGVQNSAPVRMSAGEHLCSAGHNPGHHKGALGRGGLGTLIGAVLGVTTGRAHRLVHRVRKRCEKKKGEVRPTLIARAAGGRHSLTTRARW